MVVYVEDTEGKTRDLPIEPNLKAILVRAGEIAGVDRVRVTSGGQCKIGTCTKRTGTTRHDLGRAADLEIWKEGRPLDFTSSRDLPIFRAFVEAAASLGATGMGAGVRYMGSKRIHVGFGTKALWGGAGGGGSAPDWLRDAAEEGWSSSPSPLPPSLSLRYEVIARSGLHLRSGPSTGFAILSTFPQGTVVNVSGLDGDWARVDLQGDGLIDGYVFKTFLRPIASATRSLMSTAAVPLMSIAETAVLSSEGEDDCGVDNQDDREG